MLRDTLAAVIGLFVLQALIALAGRARAKTAGGQTIYDVIWTGKLIFFAAIVILGGLPVALLLRGDDWTVVALLLPFFLLAVLGLPGPIVVDPAAGVSTRRWYGRAKRIAWNEVARLNWSKELQQTVVVSTQGHKIVHTAFHADRDGFRQQVSTFAASGTPSRVTF